MTAIKTTTKNLQELKKLGISSAEELLMYFPRRYLDFSKTKHIRDTRPGETVTLQVTIKSIQSRFSFKSRQTLCESVVQDSTGYLKVTWFNMGYLAKTLKIGDHIALAGKITNFKGLQLVNPIYEKIEGDMLHTGRFVPVYKLPGTMYQKTLRKIVHAHLPLARKIPDIIPPGTRRSFALPDLATTIQESHFPSAQEKLYSVQRRLIFEELFIQQLAVQENKKLRVLLKAPNIPANVELIKKFLSTLPFELTGGQKRALWEIMKDMEQSVPMNRLLQGDVGSGKTVVAAAAALCAVRAGFQVALLAPTEILAVQHYETIQKIFAKTTPRVKIGLHTQSLHEIDGKSYSLPVFKKAVNNGSVSILTGTHALLAGKIHFKTLGLILVDEQHRFGVRQRQYLLSEENRSVTTNMPSEPYPTASSANRETRIRSTHFLSMTATPIPRTLALSMFGELDVSVLSEMPKNRKPIETRLALEEQRLEVYAFLKKQISSGRQVYWVLPHIDESEDEDITSVKEKYDELLYGPYQDLKIGLLHGRMKADDKNAAMLTFKEGKTNILVATSVIEIGVDVPNASCMVIENAERFGLAQLHQLRGRVGRGAHQSYCFAFTEAVEEESLARIKNFTTISSGFKLAELDLENRGFGTLFGEEQSGFFFKYSKYLTMKVLQESRQAAIAFENSDNLKNHPLLEKMVAPLVEKVHLE